LTASVKEIEHSPGVVCKPTSPAGCSPGRPCPDGGVAGDGGGLARGVPKSLQALDLPLMDQARGLAGAEVMSRFHRGDDVGAIGEAMRGQRALDLRREPRLDLLALGLQNEVLLHLAQLDLVLLGEGVGALLRSLRQPDISKLLVTSVVLRTFSQLLSEAVVLLLQELRSCAVPLILVSETSRFLSRCFHVVAEFPDASLERCHGDNVGLFAFVWCVDTLGAVGGIITR